jgi:hypothetical protein
VKIGARQHHAREKPILLKEYSKLRNQYFCGNVDLGFGFPSALAFRLSLLCILDGKDTGQNNTKMLRGLNAEC